MRSAIRAKSLHWFVGYKYVDLACAILLTLSMSKVSRERFFSVLRNTWRKTNSLKDHHKVHNVSKFDSKKIISYRIYWKFLIEPCANRGRETMFIRHIILCVYRLKNEKLVIDINLVWTHVMVNVRSYHILMIFSLTLFSNFSSILLTSKRAACMTCASTTRAPFDYFWLGGECANVIDTFYPPPDDP